MMSSSLLASRRERDYRCDRCDSHDHGEGPEQSRAAKSCDEVGRRPRKTIANTPSAIPTMAKSRCGLALWAIVPWVKLSAQPIATPATKCNAQRRESSETMPLKKREAASAKPTAAMQLRESILLNRGAKTRLLTHRANQKQCREPAGLRRRETDIARSARRPRPARRQGRPCPRNGRPSARCARASSPCLSCIVIPSVSPSVQIGRRERHHRMPHEIGLLGLVAVGDFEFAEPHGIFDHHAAALPAPVLESFQRLCDAVRGADLLRQSRSRPQCRCRRPRRGAASWRGRRRRSGRRVPSTTGAGQATPPAAGRRIRD